MDRRVELHEKLVELLGSRNVYFQPPESIKLKYPCIIYYLNNMNVRKADDTAYHVSDRYDLTYIDKSPNSDFRRRIFELFPYCSFGRFYTANNLNHYTFTLFY